MTEDRQPGRVAERAELLRVGIELGRHTYVSSFVDSRCQVGSDLHSGCTRLHATLGALCTILRETRDGTSTAMAPRMMTTSPQSPADFGALRVHARSTSSDTTALMRFARDVLPSLPVHDLEPRLGSFPIVWTASRGSELAAFQLVDVSVTSGVRLVHLGPLFSRDGAWVSLFEAILNAELARDHAFCVGVEMASEEGERKLRRLLPTMTRPGPSGHVPVDERVLARWFAKSFASIGGLDDDTLRTGGRNQLLLIPCIEDDDRAALRAELARGLTWVRRERARLPTR